MAKQAPVQLLDLEAKIYEALKRSLHIPGIATSLDLDQKKINHQLTKLVTLEMLGRVGKKNAYVYTVIDRPYVVVMRRCKTNVFEDDPFLDKVRDYSLSVEQSFYLKHHRHQKRSILAKRLGLSRIQLNFALDDLGGRRREHREAGELQPALGIQG
jgi:hypothetical protein